MNFKDQPDQRSNDVIGRDAYRFIEPQPNQRARARIDVGFALTSDLLERSRVRTDMIDNYYYLRARCAYSCTHAPPPDIGGPARGEISLGARLSRRIKGALAAHSRNPYLRAIPRTVRIT